MRSGRNRRWRGRIDGVCMWVCSGGCLLQEPWQETGEWLNSSDGEGVTGVGDWVLQEPQTFAQLTSFSLSLFSVLSILCANFHTKAVTLWVMTKQSESLEYAWMHFAVDALTNACCCWFISHIFVFSRRQDKEQRRRRLSRCRLGHIPPITWADLDRSPDSHVKAISYVGYSNAQTHIWLNLNDWLETWNPTRMFWKKKNSKQNSLLSAVRTTVWDFPDWTWCKRQKQGKVFTVLSWMISFWHLILKGKLKFELVWFSNVMQNS